MAETEGGFAKVGENLVRHRGSGTIYLRAKVNGKPIRQSLGTGDLRIAKISRDALLEAKRNAPAESQQMRKISNLADGVDVLEMMLIGRPDLEPDTIKYYGQIIMVLRETLPLAQPARAWNEVQVTLWWKGVATIYSPQRANNILAAAKQLAGLLIKHGVRTDNPTERLRRRRILKREPWSPNLEQMDAIIEEVRRQGRRHSEQAANYIAFLAFAGPRHGQARAFCKGHIEESWIRFPSGISGSKGADLRRLPINPRLREVLDRMIPFPDRGPIFGISSPHQALGNACKRLRLPHLRLHDLRHFFASWAIQSGVDIPTVAKWLGHKDGGALLMKTYSHIIDGHSLASAQKLT